MVILFAWFIVHLLLAAIGLTAEYLVMQVIGGLSALAAAVDAFLLAIYSITGLRPPED